MAAVGPAERNRARPIRVPSRLRFAALLVLVAAGIAAPGSAGAQTKPPGAADPASAARVEPDAGAVALLTRMHTFIRSQPEADLRTTFALSAAVRGFGKQGSVRFRTRKPNLFHIELTVGGKQTTFVSDGRMLFIHRPAQGRYAEVLAADSMIGTMYKGAGMLALHARVLDFLWTADYFIKLGEHVRITAKGADKVAGRECRHLRVERMDDVWDVWVEDSPTPLPCKLVSRRLDDPADPVQTNELSWTIAPNLPDALFTFTKPPGAKKVYPADLD